MTRRDTRDLDRRLMADGPVPVGDRMTPWGFVWGPLEVQRATVYRGRRLVRLFTHALDIELAISPQGRHVTVIVNGRQWGPLPDPSDPVNPPAPKE